MLDIYKFRNNILTRINLQNNTHKLVHIGKQIQGVHFIVCGRMDIPSHKLCSPCFQNTQQMILVILVVLRLISNSAKNSRSNKYFGVRHIYF